MESSSSADTGGREAADHALGVGRRQRLRELLYPKIVDDKLIADWMWREIDRIDEGLREPGADPGTTGAEGLEQGREPVTPDGWISIKRSFYDELLANQRVQDELCPTKGTPEAKMKIFKTDVLGIGPWCVEFPDGEIITTRSEERARQIAATQRAPVTPPARIGDEPSEPFWHSKAPVSDDEHRLLLAVHEAYIEYGAKMFQMGREEAAPAPVTTPGRDDGIHLGAIQNGQCGHIRAYQYASSYLNCSLPLGHVGKHKDGHNGEWESGDISELRAAVLYAQFRFQDAEREALAAAKEPRG